MTLWSWWRMCSGGGGVYCRDACLVQFKVRNSKCGIRGHAVDVVVDVVVVVALVVVVVLASIS